MAARTAKSGFSLIELLVTLGITSIVMVEVLGMLYSQIQVHTSQKRVVDSQEDSRLIANMLLHDAGTAGFMIPGIVGISSVDGGIGNPDRFCATDLSVMNETNIAEETDRFDAASVSATVGAGVGSVQLVALEMDIDSDGDDDFVIGSGLIISNGTRSHCARIVSLAGNTVSFTPSTPGGFSMTTTNALAAPAVIYEISGTTLLRNNVLLSPHVEDLQVEFAVDTNGDGQIGLGEFPINSLDTAVVANVRAVQISILTRTSVENIKLSGPGRQAVANRNAAGVADGFRRRLSRVTTSLRNIP